MKQALFRLAAVLGALGFALGTVELGLRVVGYAGESDRQLIHFSPVTPPREMPESSWYFEWPDAPGPGDFVHIGGQKVPMQKDPARTRLLFLGDSGTVGLGVMPSQSFPSRFGDTVSQECGDVEVINAGIQGINTVVELFLLERLLALQPDVVVLGVFLQNDINTDLFSHRRWERYQHDARWLNALRDMRTSSALVHYIYLRLLSWNDRMPFTTKGGSWIQDLLPVEFDAHTPDGLNLGNYVEGEYALYQPTSAPTLLEAYGHVESLLVQMRNLCREADCTLVPFLIPTPAQAGGRISPVDPEAEPHLARRGFSTDRGTLDMDAPTRALLEICERNRLACVDPLDAMRSLGHETVFIAEDVHPSVKGHEVLATTLWDHRESALGWSSGCPSL